MTPFGPAGDGGVCRDPLDPTDTDQGQHITPPLPKASLLIRVAWPHWFAGAQYRDKVWWVYARLITRPLMWWHDHHLPRSFRQGPAGRPN